MLCVSFACLDLRKALKKMVYEPCPRFGFVLDTHENVQWFLTEAKCRINEINQINPINQVVTISKDAFCEQAGLT